MTQRRRARESAVEVLYRYDIVNEPIEKTTEEIKNRKQFSPQGYGYFQNLVKTTIQNLSTIDEIIKKHLKRWSFSRLALIDRAILRVASGELIYFPEVPYKVVINEAIEIAKKYGTDDSARFINGILDAIYKHNIQKKSKNSE
ncbi:MAG: transcription antitermination factor NusB [candidate division WOR-3 bacterium]